MLGTIATIGATAQETGLVDWGNTSPNVSDSDKFIRATSGASICGGKYSVKEIYPRVYSMNPADKQNFITQVGGLKKYLNSQMDLGQAVNAVVFLANGGSDCNDNTTANQQARNICANIMGLPIISNVDLPTSVDYVPTQEAYGEAFGDGGKVSQNVWENIKDSFLGTLEQNLYNIANQAQAGAEAAEAAATSAAISSSRQMTIAGMDVTTMLLLGLAAVVAYFAFLK